MGHFDVPFSDKNSERYMLSKRIALICNQLMQSRYVTDSEDTGNFFFRDGQHTFSERDTGEWTPFDCENGYWGYPECYCWFKQTVQVPERFKGQAVYYRIKPYLDSWRTVNPQIIIYCNGILMQGMDSNHKDVKLLDCAKGGDTLEIYINAHTDAREFKSEVRMKAELFTVDDVTLKLYYDVITPLEVANLYDADSTVRIDIIRPLNEALNMVDYDTDDIELYHKTALEACDYLSDRVYGKKGEPTAWCIGHTHIDVAWLWRLRQTRDKAGRSFATVLKYMEEYPDYKFMSPQAQLYDYVKHDYPEVYNGIKERIREGRWECEGSMWVEADTNVASGEALVRQFLVGKRFFRDEFGVQTKIMWLPDVFGYSGALPQIIRKSGLDYFMTTKISWNEYNKLPFDTFMWKGIDGTEVLSHFSPSRGPTDNERENYQTTYNTYLAPNEVIGGWRRYSQKDIGKNYLCSYGFGDGGGGPTRDMLEHHTRMARGIEGCPVTRQETALDFFRQLEKDVKDDRFLPIWQGELYLEFHRGTLTSQARNKKYNRKSEYMYHDVETLATIAKNTAGSEYPREKLLENWKLILLNQFHDILPGSSIKEVYEDSKVQYESVLAAGRGMIKDAQDAIISKISLSGDSYVVFNTLGCARTDIAYGEKPSFSPFKLFAPDGKETAYQLTKDGRVAFIAEAPAKGYAVYTLSEGSPAVFGKVNADADGAETDSFSLKFDDNFNITSLIHKQSGRSVAPEGELVGKTVAFEDRPHNHEAWDIKCYFEEKSWDITDAESTELVENGPVFALYKATRAFRHSKIDHYYYIYKALPRIDVKYVTDWKEKRVALKADYPVDVNASRATFDIQFGNLERSTTRNTTWDFAQFEVSMHKWCDLSDNGFGLSVINDCKYGCDIKNGHIRPTLLRCATDPNTVQDREHHEFTFAIYPHAGRVSEGDTVREAYNINFPLYVRSAGENKGELPKEYSFVSVNESNIVIETVKTAEDSDDIIIRAYETWNRRTPAVISLSDTVASVSECDLMEENDTPAVREGNTVLTTFKPYEIKTFKVKLK